jgi:5S rRNA maturation endonuclease (ribonuclease M5)
MPIDDINLLLSKLKGVKKISTGYMAMCPAHNDTHRSLSIKADVDNKAVLYCHAGCKFEDILKALGLTSAPTFHFTPVIDETYDYTDENGNLLYQVVRYHPKNFKHRRPNGKGWIWNLNGIEPVLYRLPEIIEAVGKELIWIVEGEKDVETLKSQNIIATTTSGGASARWLPQYNEILHGADIAIIPDNDEAGQARTLRIAKNLYGWAKGIKIVYLPKDIKDITDWFEQGHTKEELLEQYKVTRLFDIKGTPTLEDYLDIKGAIVYYGEKIKRLSGKRRSYEYK